MLVFTSDPCFQVESVFETLVEDSPEEESTLTSKMSMCTCVRVSLCAFQGGGQALPLGLGVESLLWCSLNLGFSLSRTWQHHLQPVWRWQHTRY